MFNAITFCLESTINPDRQPIAIKTSVNEHINVIMKNVVWEQFLMSLSRSFRVENPMIPVLRLNRADL